MAYPNGRVPLNLLVHLGGNLYMFPGTYRRWLNLVDLVQRRHSVTLRITRGNELWNDWSGYRSYDAQVIYKIKLPDLAAKPGYSSHGGSYGGRESGAFDVNNWASIGKDAFFKACRDVDLTPGIDSREPWHVVDYAPCTVPAGGVSTPFPTPTPANLLELIMANPIVNVVGKNGDPVSGGAIWTGRDDGGWEPYLQPEWKPNARGILGVVFFGSKNGEDQTAVPTVSQADFDNVVKPFWAKMCKGRTTASDVWAHKIQAQDADGKPLPGVSFEAAGFEASTNAQVNFIKKNPVAVSPEQIKAIADAVAAQIGQPDVKIDYALIADTVRAKFKSEPLS